MSDKLHQLLFPREYREFPQQRIILNILRAAHILCFSILVGGIFFKQPSEFLLPWTIATVLSGLGIFFLDLFNSCIALFEIRGVTILVKIILLLLIPFTEGWSQLSILFVIVIFSSLVSHTSRRIRHLNILPKTVQQKYGLHSYKPNTKRNHKKSQT